VELLYGENSAVLFCIVHLVLHTERHRPILTDRQNCHRRLTALCNKITPCDRDLKQLDSGGAREGQKIPAYPF